MKLLPQILMKIFQFLSDASLSSTENTIKDCFMSCKELLQIFLSVFDEIKIKTVLEDELEMLVILCQDLVKFHEVLVPGLNAHSASTSTHILMIIIN